MPPGSLLAAFGGPEDYRDCFIRDVPNVDGGEVSLAQFIERFYSSTAFLPERLILKALGTPASRADIRALARGETDRFGAWRVVERRDHNAGGEVAEHGPAGSASPTGRPQARKGRGNRSAEALRKTRLEEILLESKDTNTASWFAVEPRKDGTRLYFGSWVGGIDQSGWRGLMHAHVWYSRVLLGGV
ncbi:hypothetical protein [Erythrobacter rubeus]|uniref:hypothetical protein n=1 Tax=Erythrobacter rubeus TaxID=2760803 RepID=UPI001F45640B|nr:hypothetical protein [Erythrobacter rubeus]